MLISTSAKLEPNHIASFSRPQIENLPGEDLVQLVRASRLPFLSATDVARLPNLGRKSLLRLGFLAREFCRNAARSTRWSALSE